LSFREKIGQTESPPPEPSPEPRVRRSHNPHGCLDRQRRPAAGTAIVEINASFPRKPSERSSSLTLFDVAQFSAAKWRRSLAGGENPRFRDKQRDQAPKGRRLNLGVESSVALTGL